MQQEIPYLFVYGSLRRGFHHPAYSYISRYFTFIANASVQGVLFDMGDYPAAMPVTDDGRIAGELYRITNPDEFAWAMAQLDDYEGLHTEPGEKALYRREMVVVQAGEIQETAWIYWFNGDVNESARIAGGDVLEYLARKK